MKRTLILIFTVALVLSLSACGGGASFSYDAAATADKLAQDIEFGDDLTDITTSMITKLYNIDESSFISAKVYMSTGATAEEIAVFEAKSTDDAKTIEAAVKTRIEKQKESYRDYIPEELPKLENPVIITDGNYVFLCVSNRNDSAKEIINSMKQTK